MTICPLGIKSALLPQSDDLTMGVKTVLFQHQAEHSIDLCTCASSVLALHPDTGYVGKGTVLCL